MNRKYICPICGSQEYEAYNSDYKRLCTECKSLERTRTFARLYDEEFHKFFVENGHNLHISPSNAEKRFMKSRGISAVTMDIRPECKTDIIGDICNMPEIKTESIDTILACCVLNHVYDDEKAVNEFRRILKESGSCFLWVQGNGKRTRKMDQDEIIKWYGSDNYEQYKVGTFRMYGTDDFLKLLSSVFEDVKCYKLYDDITGKMERWYRCTKQKES